MFEQETPVFRSSNKLDADSFGTLIYNFK